MHEDKYFEMKKTMVSHAINDFIKYIMLTSHRIKTESEEKSKQIIDDGISANYYLFGGGIDAWVTVTGIEDELSPSSVRKILMRRLNVWLDIIDSAPKQEQRKFYFSDKFIKAMRYNIDRGVKDWRDFTWDTSRESTGQAIASESAKTEG